MPKRIRNNKYTEKDFTSRFLDNGKRLTVFDLEYIERTIKSGKLLPKCAENIDIADYLLSISSISNYVQGYSNSILNKDLNIDVEQCNTDIMVRKYLDESEVLANWCLGGNSVLIAPQGIGKSHSIPKTIDYMVVTPRKELNKQYVSDGHKKVTTIQSLMNKNRVNDLIDYDTRRKQTHLVVDEFHKILEFGESDGIVELIRCLRHFASKNRLHITTATNTEKGLVDRIFGTYTHDYYSARYSERRVVDNLTVCNTKAAMNLQLAEYCKDNGAFIYNNSTAGQNMCVDILVNNGVSRNDIYIINSRYSNDRWTDGDIIKEYVNRHNRGDKVYLLTTSKIVVGYNMLNTLPISKFIYNYPHDKLDDFRQVLCRCRNEVSNIFICMNYSAKATHAITSENYRQFINGANYNIDKFSVVKRGRKKQYEYRNIILEPLTYLLMGIAITYDIKNITCFRNADIKVDTYKSPIAYTFEQITSMYNPNFDNKYDGYCFEIGGLVYKIVGSAIICISDRDVIIEALSREDNAEKCKLYQKQLYTILNLLCKLTNADFDALYNKCNKVWFKYSKPNCVFATNIVSKQINTMEVVDFIEFDMTTNLELFDYYYKDRYLGSFGRVSDLADYMGLKPKTVKNKISCGIYIKKDKYDIKSIPAYNRDKKSETDCISRELEVYNKNKKIKGVMKKIMVNKDSESLFNKSVSNNDGVLDIKLDYSKISVDEVEFIKDFEVDNSMTDILFAKLVAANKGFGSCVIDDYNDYIEQSNKNFIEWLKRKKAFAEENIPLDDPRRELMYDAIRAWKEFNSDDSEIVVDRSEFFNN